MLKIHITGANGGIGTQLSKALKAEGNELILAKDSTLRIENPSYFEQFDDPSSIDIIYHLAAISFVPKSWEQPAEFIKVNVLGTTNVLEFCRKNKIQIVYVSSYAYGIPAYLPIDENHPISAANPYGLSKIMGEQLCDFYGENYDVPYAIIRPFNVYGGMSNKALLIPEVIDQIIRGDAIHVKDLSPKRDHVFIDDLITFLVLVKKDLNNNTYNIGSGVSLSVAQIIETCQKVWNTNLPVISEKIARKNEIPETLCNNSKAINDFGWDPQFNFEQGIRAIKSRIENQTL